MENALADLLEEAILRNHDINGDDLKLRKEARRGLLCVLQNDVHCDLDTTLWNGDVNCVKGGIINAGLNLTNVKREHLVASTTLNECCHLAIEHAGEYIGIMADILVPPVVGSCHE